MKQGSISITPGRLASAYDRAVRKGVKDQIAPRIMKRDASVFNRKVAVKKLIANRLGWVDSAALMNRRVAEIEKFAADVLRDGIKHVVLMGMGGSSLCPDLFRLMCHRPKGLKSFDVIDSTDPSAVKALARKITLKKTLFIVASKSGGTVETRSHEAYFAGLLREAGVKNIGRHFVAITDPGSGLQKDARRLRFRKVFVNPSDIGGRYSALSYFGLVPGFFAGVNLKALVDDALMMQKLLNARSDDTNPALLIGALMTAGAEVKCDKLTFVASKKASPLVPWIEQLVAESTGKAGQGVIPIEAEPSTLAAKYAKDRMFVFLKMVGESTLQADKLQKDLRKRKAAIIEITLGSVNELGRQFLLWEAATAICGCLMKINPFDEPNVTESKNNTTEILAAFERAGELPFRSAHSRWGKLALVAHGGESHRPKLGETLPQLLKRFFKGSRAPKYFSLLNYFQSDSRCEKVLQKIRATVRDHTGMATLRGYGPRYLHSIGQLYKGGPATGMFVVFVRSNYGHLSIPGKAFGFGELIAAQSIGDAQALISRNLPTLVFAIDGSASAGLDTFSRALAKALK